MARLQVEGIAPVQLQSQSAGRIAVNTTAPASKSGQLLSALASGGSAVAQGFAKYKEGKDAVDTTEADAFFNSMKLGDVGKLVKEGKLPVDSSPVFRARVEHNYGSNYLAQVTRDAQEKLANGEFSVEGRSPQEGFETYITDARNKFLEGASKYTVAGFDKNYNATKLKFEEVISNQNTAERMMEAQGSVTESAYNNLSTFVKADALGVKSVEAGGIAKVVTSVRAELDQTHQSPFNRKGVFANLATEIATLGDPAALKEYMDTDLGNGLTIEKVISGRNPEIGRKFRADAATAQASLYRKEGERHHDVYTQQAERGELDVEEFNRVRPTFEPYMDWGDLVARNQARRESMSRDNDRAGRVLVYNNTVNKYNDAAYNSVLETQATGNVVRGEDLEVTTVSGGSQTLKREEFITDAIDKVAGEDPAKRARLYASYNYVDKRSKLELSQLVSNINNTANKDGKLPESAAESYKLFQLYDKTNPAYTKFLMGDAAYTTAQELSLHVQMGDSLDQGASLIRLVNQSGLDTTNVSTRKLAESVEVKMADVMSRSWMQNVSTKIFSNPTERDLFLGDDAMYGGLEMTNAVTRRAKALVLSGQAATAEEAIRTSFESLKSSGAMVKANERMYWRSDLPSKLPDNMQPPEAMQVFREMVRTKLGGDQQFADVENILLVPNRNGSFTVKVRDQKGNIFIPHVGANPLVYTLRDVEHNMQIRSEKNHKTNIGSFKDSSINDVKPRGPRGERVVGRLDGSGVRNPAAKPTAKPLGSPIANPPTESTGKAKPALFRSQQAAPQ